MSIKPKPHVPADCEKILLERTIQLNNTRSELAKRSKMLVSKRNELRSLSARLLHAQDEERRRIARELHDSLGQGLALLCFDLAKLREDLEGPLPGAARALFEKVEFAKKLSEELRTISYLLHPPLLDDFGLLSALRWYAEGFEKRTGITVDLALPAKCQRLTRDMETAVYRIVQECLTNIYRHSKSQTAFIGVSSNAREISLAIRDWGIGLSRQQLREIDSRLSIGVGLRGIEERVKLFGGSWQVTSAKPGTLVEITFPL